MSFEELTAEEISELSIGDKRKYEEAVFYSNCKNAAGPMGGWVKGHEMLKEMGWTEVVHEAGIRQFVSLKKPVKLKVV